MSSGISIYPGLDNSVEENLQLINLAHKHGITRIFTSFHIPETDKTRFHQEAFTILKAGSALGMDIISDISPATMEVLGIEKTDTKAFKKLGISTLRLDYGFSAEEIAQLSRNSHGLKIQLNASSIKRELLESLAKAGACFDTIDALHNFYPRENTGLSKQFFLKKNMLLMEFGISISAFIPSMKRPRSPVKAGVPTLEEHRGCSLDYAARELSAMGCSVFIGDSLPSEDELANVAQCQPGHTLLKAEIITREPAILKLLENNSFTARPDEARDVIRAQEARGLMKGISIASENTISRPRGAITIDNESYHRYQGELQILKKPLPPDRRVNVIALLDNMEQRLIEYILPETKFSILKK